MPEDSFGRRAEQVDTNSPSFVLTLFMQTADLRFVRRKPGVAGVINEYHHAA